MRIGEGKTQHFCRVMSMAEKSVQETTEDVYLSPGEAGRGGLNRLA